MKLTEAKTMTDALRWIVENEHYEGWWSGPMKNPNALHLRGDGVELRIPSAIHVPGLMEPADFKATSRMYLPSEAGRTGLKEQGR